MKKILINLILLLSFSQPIIAGTAEEGVISELYIDEAGNIAVKLNGGYPTASGECPGNNGWAGNTSADPTMKSALLAAKATGNTVSLSISGCDSVSSTWLKINAVYVK